MGRPTVTKENFWHRVQIGSPKECWNWTGPVSRTKKTHDGYGRIDAFGVTGVYAHRVAYWLTNPDAIALRKTDETLVRHSCDNTLCCNPNHLLLGTHLDNMRDKVERGRSHWCESSTQSPRAKLSAEDVQDIRLHRKMGVARRALAMLYDVSVSTIGGVTSGRHYEDVI